MSRAYRVTLHFAAGALALMIAVGPAPLAAQEATEDKERFCPLVTPELAKEISVAMKGIGVCDVDCRGCGCKGGPGYRETSTDRCVGWIDLIETCGPPPHSLCKAECEPVAKGCAGRAWIKQLAKDAELDVSFIEGRERPRKAKKGAAREGTDTEAQGLLSTGFQCSGKRECAEMQSCEEARFYLTRCGATWLDGDGNGRPCHELCKPDPR